MRVHYRPPEQMPQPARQLLQQRQFFQRRVRRTERGDGIGAMFVLEYLVRHRVLPDWHRIGVLGTVRACTRHFQAQRFMPPEHRLVAESGEKVAGRQLERQPRVESVQNPTGTASAGRSRARGAW